MVYKIGAVEVTRTPDRRFRKPLLYPAELPPQNVIKIYFKRFFDPRKFTLITRSCNPSFGQNPNLGNLR